MHYVASRLALVFQKNKQFCWYSGDAMIVAGVWKCVEIERIWAVISWSLNISVCCSCIASSTLAEAQTLQGGDTVMLYTLTYALVMLRWQGRLSSSQGEQYTTYTQCFVRQGRCKVTGVTWPGCNQTTVTTATPAEIRAESLTVLPQGENQFSTQQKCTTSLSRKNSFETWYKNASCNQSGQITVLKCRARAQNNSY